VLEKVVLNSAPMRNPIAMPNTTPSAAISPPTSNGAEQWSGADPQRHADADLSALRLDDTAGEVERRESRPEQHQDSHGDSGALVGVQVLVKEMMGGSSSMVCTSAPTSGSALARARSTSAAAALRSTPLEAL